MRVYKSIFCCFLTSFSFLLLSCFLQPATFKFDFKIFELWALFVNLSMFWFFIFPVTFFKKRYLSNALYLCSHSRRLFSSILSKIIKSFSWKRCYSLLLIWKILNPSDIVTWLSKHVVSLWSTYQYVNCSYLNADLQYLAHLQFVLSFRLCFQTS